MSEKTRTIVVVGMGRTEDAALAIAKIQALEAGVKIITIDGKDKTKEELMKEAKEVGGDAVLFDDESSQLPDPSPALMLRARPDIIDYPTYLDYDRNSGSKFFKTNRNNYKR